VAAAGLVVFCAACAACAAAGDLPALVSARTAQGAGGALLLAGALPALGALLGDARRGAVWWGTAGVVGAAVGPAAGGALTQAFDWRAIFIAQVPLAAAALVATARLPAPRAEAGGAAAPGRGRIAAGAALALISAALVGALFLAVVLMIDGWGLAPLAAAAVVTALPVGALAAGPVAARSEPRVAVAGGIALVAAGLAAMALLPGASIPMLAWALALTGLGLGLAVAPLTAASLRGRSLAASGTWSVGARHAGLVLGLVLLAPLLAHDLEDTGARARLAGVAAIVDAPLSIERKVEVGRGLERAIDEAPAGEVPDVGAALAGGAPEERPVLDGLRRDLEALVELTITRGFRRAFGLCALLALAALAPAELPRRGAAP
jgi:MFS family permease